LFLVLVQSSSRYIKVEQISTFIHANTLQFVARDNYGRTLKASFVAHVYQDVGTTATLIETVTPASVGIFKI
jgi:hypothetical protein